MYIFKNSPTESAISKEVLMRFRKRMDPQIYFAKQIIIKG